MTAKKKKALLDKYLKLMIEDNNRILTNLLDDIDESDFKSYLLLQTNNYKNVLKISEMLEECETEEDFKKYLEKENFKVYE